MIDTKTVWDVGFRYTYLPERFSEEQNAMYSENETLTLPLNPTYVYIRILFSKPRLIIKLMLVNVKLDFNFELKLPDTH